MKWILFLAAWALTFVTGLSEGVTMVSYNIHHGVGMDGKMDLARVGGVLKKLDADVIALQEVDQLTKRSGKVDQAAYLAKQLGMHHVFGKAMNFQGGAYGQAILSKFPILESKVHKLPGSGEPRIALEVVVAPKKGSEISLVSIHFDHRSEKMRQARIQALFTAMKEVKHPVVLLGDFNAQPNSESIALFKSDWSVVPKRGNPLTQPADKPRSEIDYFMLRGWEAKGLLSEVIEEKQASDHRPIRMRVPLDFATDAK